MKSCAHSSVFRNSYHDIPKNLVALAGKEELSDWAFSLADEDKCAVNIVSFYRYFSEKDETFAAKFRDFALGDGAYYCDIPDVSLFEEGNPAGIKAALHARGVIACQKLRSPLCEVSEALYQKIKRLGE